MSVSVFKFSRDSSNEEDENETKENNRKLNCLRM